MLSVDERKRIGERSPRRSGFGALAETNFISNAYERIAASIHKPFREDPF
jgi:hypothetical protein